MLLFAPPPPKRSKPAPETSTATAAASAPPLAAAAQLAAASDGGFRALGVSEWLNETLRELGIRRPTAVQRACIPPLLTGGRDVLGEAPTGQGKTLAFAVPILDQLSRDPYGVFALVVTPTRELAAQIADQFRALGAQRAVSVLLVVGGEATTSQALELSRRPHVVVATPGRLADLIIGTGCTAPDVFARVRFVVFDEADRVLGHSARGILRNIILPVLPKPGTPDCRYAWFTATAAPLLSNIARLPIAPNPSIYASVDDPSAAAAVAPLTSTNKATLVEGCKQQYVFTPAAEKECQLVYTLRGLLQRSELAQAMVFTSSCRRAELLHQMFVTLEIASVSLHSQLQQKTRVAALEAFRSGTARVLISTDIASRGLDIPAVRLVINYDMPATVDDYVHRVGRTARAGRSGTALSLVTPDDVAMLHKIEANIGRKLDAHSPPVDDVLFHLSEATSAMEVAEMFLEQTHFGEQRKLLEDISKKK